MGFHGNPVAVLDMKSDQVLPFDKCDIEGKDCIPVDVPRLKSNVAIYIKRPNEAKGELEGKGAPEGKGEFIAEVNLWRMGVRYNLHRLLGNEPQLYVMNA
ncbi:hypothetical protein FPOAC1_007638 [Fusarium poae]|uniref:hypothetical protein n=1 Tax=Fusarium poae TaxID=36050 RepID=UPI001CE998F7|nr:hypothetical protein FPOAC1_007638 [Fusarium poae]KAG8668260.1 hypothetical protein FPOAC1_007638 [Fusarium poae]